MTSKLNNTDEQNSLSSSDTLKQKEQMIDIELQFKINQSYGGQINKTVNEIISYVHSCAGTIILSKDDRVIREYINILLSNITNQIKKS
ncbi:hypothetical protein LCGC14_2130590 [marine sediment metagenome]|uniref:Uncharacterized protein n=1 Tax=marine sediment metagenome TaxID=412755 RepID=A0A0F9E1I1_9ZZZZ